MDLVIKMLWCYVAVFAPFRHAMLQIDRFKLFAVSPDFSRKWLIAVFRHVDCAVCAVMEANPDLVAVKHLYVDDLCELHICRLYSAEHGYQSTADCCREASASVSLLWGGGIVLGGGWGLFGWGHLLAGRLPIGFWGRRSLLGWCLRLGG